jgi:hypothetical protein
MHSTGENLFLSFLITASTMVFLVVVYVLIRYKAQIKQRLSGVEAALGTSPGVTLFRVTQLLVGLAGIAALLLTFLPGLFPFLDPYLNKNLELGGILYIFIWPILLFQIVMAFIPYSKSLIVRQSVAAWVILLVAGYMAISFDMLAINGMYEFNLQS